jgi:phosphonopyruvate decarboxylase
VLEPAQFHAWLVEAGVGFFTGVPDSLLKEYCAHLDGAVERDRHVIAANEGGAVAIAMGHHLGTGGVALVYLQNSGLGNVVNPVLSLATAGVYAVPCVLLVGWRGEPGRKDEPQHLTQGQVTPQQLALLDVPFEVLPDAPEQARSTVAAVVARARSESRPCALLVRAGTFSTGTGSDDGVELSALGREEAITAVLGAAADDTLVVATTGMISREVYEHRTRHRQAPRDFLTVGGMGHASSIALGLALSRPDRQVLLLDGDGAAVMHLGALAVIGDRAPTNLRHVLLNNGAHDSVGGQPTSARSVDLPGLARACGYRSVDAVDTLTGLTGRLPAWLSEPGPLLLEVRVRRGARADLGRPSSSPQQNKAAFMAHAGPA